MTITTFIESVGPILLGTNADLNYEILDNSTDPGTEVSITLDGDAVNATFFANAGWTMTQAVANPDADGYKVLFENADGRTSIWTLDLNGARTEREDVVGNSAIWATELLFDADIDGDEEIGEPVSTDTVTDTGTDASGDLTVGISDIGGEYFVLDNSTTPPTEVAVTLNGAAVNAAVFTAAGWTMTQAVANPDADGYEVLFENADGRTSIWTLDLNGARTEREDVVGNSAIWATELLFDADIDGDEEIGEPVSTDTVADTGTDTSGDLTVGISDIGGEYFVLDNSTTPPTEVAVTLNGAAVNAAVFTAAGWTMTQAVANPDADGYKVLFENADGRTSIWTLDLNGARTEREDVVGNSAIWATELLFDADIDGDEEIGEPVSTDTVTDTGTDTSGDLTVGISDIGGEYFVLDNSTTPPTEVAVTLNGAAVNAAVFTAAGWTMTQAVANPDADGYEVLFENADGRTSIWTLDLNGARTEREDVVGNSAIWATELLFDADIDGDEEIGEPVSTDTVADTGTDTSGDLTVGISDIGGEYFVLDNSTTPPTEVAVTLNGAAVNAAVFTAAGWTMTQAVANPDADGYEVLFENADGRTSIWTLDLNGARTEREDVVGNSAIWATELLFDADIDGDEEIGEPVSTDTVADTGTDTSGDLTVGISDIGGEYFVLDNSTTPPTEVAVTLNGAAVNAAVFTAAGWTMSQAVANPNPEIDGYQVLFENADGRTSIWTLDINGDRTERADVSGDAAIWAAEVLFQADIDGNEQIGEPTIDPVADTGTDTSEDDFSVGISDIGGNYFVLDNSTTPAGEVGVTLNGAPVNAAVFTAAGWTMTQAVANPDPLVDGYQVLFENADGRVSIWTLDINGDRTERADVAGDSVMPAEVLFGVNLEGGLEVGDIEIAGDVALSIDEFGDYYVREVVADVPADPGTALRLEFDPDGMSPDTTDPDTPYLDEDPATDTFVWTAVAAENEVGGDGYQVLWEGADASGTVTDYLVRIYDSNAVALFDEELNDSVISAVEAEFDYDIPDDFVFAIA